MYKPIIVIALTLLFCPILIFAQTSKNIDELNASEAAFDKLVLDSGVKKAFLVNIDAQGITFYKDRPVNGFDYWANAPQKELVISRQPVISAVSADGSLGYNIGSSTAKNSSKDEKAIYTGYFFSVWKRDSSGKFKVVLDGGVSKPEPNQQSAESLQPNGAKLTPNLASTATTAPSNIMAIDNNFNGDLVIDINESYKANLANKSWLLRSNNNATTTKAENLETLKTCKISKYMLTCLGSGIAGSNDMAYTYGKAELNVQTEPGMAKYVTGFYYRTWQKFGNKWKIVADMVSYQL